MGKQDRGYKALNLNMFLSALYTELRKIPSSGARNFLQLMLINSTQELLRKILKSSPLSFNMHSSF